MSTFKKNLSLIATIAVILIASVAGYYFINLKHGPYPVSTFVAVDFKWGVGAELPNSYNSVKGEYKYLDNKDSLHIVKVKLRANEIIFLHGKINELDFWQLPDVIANPNSDLKSAKILRYEIVFTYEQKRKKVIYLTDYTEDQGIAVRADELQKIITKTINEAEERYSK